MRWRRRRQTNSQVDTAWWLTLRSPCIVLKKFWPDIASRNSSSGPLGSRLSASFWPSDIQVTCSLSNIVILKGPPWSLVVLLEAYLLTYITCVWIIYLHSVCSTVQDFTWVLEFITGVQIIEVFFTWAIVTTIRPLLEFLDSFTCVRMSAALFTWHFLQTISLKLIFRTLFGRDFGEVFWSRGHIFDQNWQEN